MIILGIETSCDETAVCVLEVRERENERASESDAVREYKVLNNAVLSQIKLHEQYGGVFPMLAKREHAKNLVPLLEETFSKLKKTVALEFTPLAAPDIELIRAALVKEPELFALLKDSSLLTERPNIDAIAVTQGPGLEPALWVGINFAQTLGKVWNVPVLPINHMEGHIVASLLDTGSHTEFTALKSVQFPVLSVLISGGHTEMILTKEYKHYSIVGKTRDDAVGEAFDKVARLLGLPYPGGPQISHLAQAERVEYPEARGIYKLPRPMLHSADLDFSFSGIKTAVLYTLQKITGSTTDLALSTTITPDIKHQIAREFEDAVTEVLISKTTQAITKYNIQTLILGGGVTANTYIRSQFEALAASYDIPLLLPHTTLSTDNALMIALAGAIEFGTRDTQKGDTTKHERDASRPARVPDFTASGNLSLSSD